MPATQGEVHGPIPSAEWLATGLLAATCVAAPLAIGATGAWARLATEAAMGIAAAAWAASAVRRPRAALMPLVVAGLLAVQLLPLPDGMLASLSPVSAAAWKVAHADATTQWGRLTVDPAATAAGIRRLLLAAAVIVAVADLGRRLPLRKLLCHAIAVVCVAIWALGLAFPFDRHTLVMLGFIDCTGPIAAEFWKTPVEPPISTNGSGNLETVKVGGWQYESATWIAADAFGPYRYSNHFAGAICLTLPVALGAWLAWARRRVPGFVRHAVVVAIFAAALWTSGVMATSRAGAVSLVLAALVFASLTFERPWPRRLAYTATAAYAALVAAFTIAFYGGFEGIDRLFPAALQPRVTAMLADGRAVAARMALRMFAAAPLLGSGLGTFGELFTRFLRSGFLLHFAHNDYAQWLAETGLLGAGLVAGFMGSLASRWWRWWRAPAADGHADPLVAGLWAALAGIGVHTAYDWNLHIPANALLACVVAGLAAASGAPAGDEPPRRPRPTGLWPRLPGMLLAAACLAAVALLARDAASDAVQRQLRQAVVAARLSALDTTNPPAGRPLREAIAAGERMAAWDPANASLAVLVGLCHLHLSAERDAGTDPQATLAAADRWFATARRSCATVRELPAELPPPPRRP